jgi:hypothetical protein
MTSIAPASPTNPLPLTRGHWRSLELLENTDAVLQTLRLYERVLGSPVYLRPTDKGLTVLSLDTTPLAMVGVGPSGGGCCVTTLPPSEAQVAAAVAAYRTKVAAMTRRSAEERYVVGRIRAALESRLQLGDGLRFLHQEWRFTTGGKLDLLAIDCSSGHLVVVEVKSTEGKALDAGTLGQAITYADLLTASWPEYAAYFRRLTIALARIYDPSAPGQVISDQTPPRCEVWWPGGRCRASELPARPADVPPSRVLRREAGSFNWRPELVERQSRWREQQGHPMGLHRGEPLRTRLLMPDAERQRWNFLTPAIGKLVASEYAANAQRSGGARKLYGYPRLFDNLLSSQPLAFNLFGELALDLDAATVACRSLWPGRVDTVTRIDFEWSPGRQSPQYLNNGTAADIAVLHTTPQGGAGAIFIETKYYEDMTAKTHRIKPRYREVAKASGAFLDDAFPRLQEGWLQQLWLDHLLVLATRDTDRLDTGLFVVMYPEVNPRCRAALDEYKATLTPSGMGTFEARTLEDVVGVMGRELSASWVADFAERYLTQP